MIKTGLNESIANRLTDTSLRYIIHLPAENLSLSSFFNSFTRGPLCESMESFLDDRDLRHERVTELQIFSF